MEAILTGAVTEPLLILKRTKSVNYGSEALLRGKRATPASGSTVSTLGCETERTVSAGTRLIWSEAKSFLI